MSELNGRDRFKLTTPVVLIVFNRPRETEIVFQAISRAMPEKLYIIGDGARSSRPSEPALVNEVRQIVSKVGWPCEVFTNFADENLGCRDRVASGLTWVFENEDEAIILEDDCLPDPTFFRYCQEMLKQHRQDESISIISGSNLTGLAPKDNSSYWYSSYAQIWGWATWKRVWDQYDVAASGWPNFRKSEAFKQKTRTKGSRLYWVNAFEAVYKGHLDTWDYQLALLAWQKNLKSVVPRANLISNIGFGATATHTINDASEFSAFPIVPLDFPLKHPPKKNVDFFLDGFIEDRQFRMSPGKYLLTTFYSTLPVGLQKLALACIRRGQSLLGKVGKF